MSVAIGSRSDKVDKVKSAQTLKSTDKVRAEIGSDVHPARLNAGVVEVCLEQLDALHKPRLQLSRQKQEFAQIQETMQHVGQAVDGLETGFELNTMRALDQMVGELLPKHNKRE